MPFFQTFLVGPHQETKTEIFWNNLINPNYQCLFNEVYITNTASYFPNSPVSNDEMEEYLGYINASLPNPNNRFTQ